VSEKQFCLAFGAFGFEGGTLLLDGPGVAALR
jgi:hypothetical protein